MQKARRIFRRAFENYGHCEGAKRLRQSPPAGQKLVGDRHATRPAGRVQSATGEAGS